MTVFITMGKRVSSEVTISKGFKEDCYRAPTLFKIYLNEILTSWTMKRNMGIPIGDWWVFTLHFADDQVLLENGEL